MSNYSIFLINPFRLYSVINRPLCQEMDKPLPKQHFLGFYVCFEEPTSYNYNWYVPFNFIGYPLANITIHNFAEPIFAPRKSMIRLGNIRHPYIDDNLDDIQQKFESYVLSIDSLDHSSSEFYDSVVSNFPDGIFHLKQVIAARETKRPRSVANDLTAYISDNQKL